MSSDVFKCLEMTADVQKCLKMSSTDSKFFQCLQMFQNVVKAVYNYFFFSKISDSAPSSVYIRVYQQACFTMASIFRTFDHISVDRARETRSGVYSPQSKNVIC